MRHMCEVVMRSWKSSLKIDFSLPYQTEPRITWTNKKIITSQLNTSCHPRDDLTPNSEADSRDYIYI